VNKYDHIHWEDDPGGREPLLHIIHADHTKRIETICLSDRWFGVFGHWDEEKRRNVPCLDPFAPCVCRDRPVPTWWRCYLAALRPSKKVGLVEVTKDAFQACHMRQVAEGRGTLRGIKVVLDRRPRIKTGAVVVELYDPGTDTGDLPPAPNVKRELERIWFSRL